MLTTLVAGSVIIGMASPVAGHVDDEAAPIFGIKVPSGYRDWPVVNKVFGHQQSFIAGPPTNVQFMVKDSKKYAATGGWGFAQFKDGKVDTKADLKTCFPCHEPIKARDYVFTQYAPTP